MPASAAAVALMSAYDLKPAAPAKGAHPHLVGHVHHTGGDA
jgi:hypothetical protein